MQALYQWQLTGQDVGEGEALCKQFVDSEDFPGADATYFDDLVRGAILRHAELDAVLSGYADRPVSQIDPVERAILWLGLYEIIGRLDVPHRAVINEAVELSKKFGATDGHKYINALLDRAARELRVDSALPTASMHRRDA